MLRIRYVIHWALALVVGLTLSGCSTLSTRGQLYPNIYSERPAAILVMPPINETNHVEAKDYLYTSLMMPLAERGYYVFSPYLAMELLRSESAADAEMFIDGSLKPFRDVFMADAALFTIIKKWDKSVLSNTIDIEIEYILKSTTTQQELFRRNIDAQVDFTEVSGGGILGMLVNAVITASTEKIVGARKVNAYALSDLPMGRFSPLHNKDGAQRAQASKQSGIVIR